MTNILDLVIDFFISSTNDNQTQLDYLAQHIIEEFPSLIQLILSKEAPQKQVTLDPKTEIISKLVSIEELNFADKLAAGPEETSLMSDKI